MSNFDLSNLALQAVCPGNEILYDDKGKPSVMVKIPKLSYKQLGMGSSDAIHPAFIVGGQEIDAIWISKYHNIVVDGRAYSLPGQDPRANIDFDQARAACSAKGRGWHLMTAMERGLLVNWCENNEFIPLGNNDYGKHSSEVSYKGIPTHMSGDKIGRVATGTGPLTWYHDNSPSGIDGLGGNVRDWVGGLRTVYGEVQILANNNGADSMNSQSESGLDWKAIKASDGTLITPNGSGTTSGSVKMDWISSKLTYSATITDANPGEHYCTIANVLADSSVGENAQLLLKSLGLLPRSSEVLSKNQHVYFNNSSSERSFICGGHYSNTSNGFGTFHGLYGRAYSLATLGFRSAFVELPSA